MSHVDVFHHGPRDPLPCLRKECGPQPRSAASAPCSAAPGRTLMKVSTMLASTFTTRSDTPTPDYATTIHEPRTGLTLAVRHPGSATTFAGTRAPGSTRHAWLSSKAMACTRNHVRLAHTSPIECHQCLANTTICLPFHKFTPEYPASTSNVGGTSDADSSKLVLGVPHTPTVTPCTNTSSGAFSMLYPGSY